MELRELAKLFWSSQGPGVCHRCVQSLFIKGMGFLSPRDDNGFKRFTFTKQGRLGIALYPETFIEEEREIFCCSWRWMTPLKANCWGGECFAYVCTCIQGLKSFCRAGKITGSSGYALYTWLYCTEENVQRMLKQQIYSKRFNRFFSYSHTV